jgi:hypothetical protein
MYIIYIYIYIYNIRDLSWQRARDKPCHLFDILCLMLDSSASIVRREHTLHGQRSGARESLGLGLAYGH